ncbi:L,D-transpeptidase [Bosea sp. 124]|uniref:L,D-transpeptidase n=1 Tax=Bosea sp. 124 TaxID=2135642 RepID=UPI000D3D014D|nr:L,D-transpeptidase [Bosea sp. 124]PTM40524.1 L,D-transpeptidase-like protein [Bosea sp. 124]
MAKRIVVSLKDQQLVAYEGTKKAFTFDCMTGDADHPTDKGVFYIIWKSKNHVSKAYGVKMHFALFFTTDGKAIHQYHAPGFHVTRSLKKNASDWFGSHGCVRLQEEDAKRIYKWAQVKTSVTVI